MTDLNTENLDEFTSEISQYKKKFTKEDYEFIFKEVKSFTYGATIGEYNDWDEVNNILENLKDIVTVIVDRNLHIGDYDDNRNLIDDENDNNSTYENIIGIMDKILDQTLDDEPYCDTENGEIIEQYKKDAYRIIQDTIAYIKGSGYSECCDDIFYRWAVIDYDKVIEIAYRDYTWDEDEELYIATSFKDFQKFIRDTYLYSDDDLNPEIFTITFASNLYEKAPILKIDLRNVGFTDLDIEDFAITTLLTYLCENWNNIIGYEHIIKQKEYDPEVGIVYTEDENCLQNVCLYDMMTTADKNGENDKMTLGEFKQSNTLMNI